MKRVVLLLVISSVLSSCFLLRNNKKSDKRFRSKSIESSSPIVENEDINLVTDSVSFIGGGISEVILIERSRSIVMDRGEGIGLGSVGTIGHGVVGSSSNTNTSNNVSNSNDISGVELSRGYNRGHIVYYIPDTMDIGKSYRLVLRISYKKFNEMYRGMDIGSIRVDGVRVSESMEAILKDGDNAFDIRIMNSGVQSIENDSSYTEWVWYVAPIKSGRHVLKLVITIKAPNLTKDIPVYEDNVYIKMSPVYSIKTFVISYWEFLLSSIIIPLIIFLYKRRRGEG